jgi:hypothetical protein
MSESVAGTVTSNTSTIVSTASGRSNAGRSQQQGRNGQLGRSRNGRHGQNRPNQGSESSQSSRGTFKGNTIDMNGQVFECYEERGDRTQFLKTLEALGEYAAKKLKYPEDLQSLFQEEMN